MHELTYDIPGGLIAVLLFVLMALAVEAGHRLGRRRGERYAQQMRDHVHTVQGSLLGILAIVLGFTLSLALERYDSRSQAVVVEANALGTAWLRTDLLSPAVQGGAREALTEVLDLRIAAGRLNLAQHGERQNLAVRTAAAQAKLWDAVRRAVAADPGPSTGGLFAQAVNEAIDSAGSREAALDRHVPEPILDLLFVTLLLAGGMVGYCAGLAGHRPAVPGYLLAALIVALVFLVLDLDRPRRGVIQVSQQALIELRANWAASLAPPAASR